MPQIIAKILHHHIAIVINLDNFKIQFLRVLTVFQHI